MLLKTRGKKLIKPCSPLKHTGTVFMNLNIKKTRCDTVHRAKIHTSAIYLYFYQVRYLQTQYSPNCNLRIVSKRMAALLHFVDKLLTKNQCKLVPNAWGKSKPKLLKNAKGRLYFFIPISREAVTLSVGNLC